MLEPDRGMRQFKGFQSGLVDLGHWTWTPMKRHSPGKNATDRRVKFAASSTMLSAARLTSRASPPRSARSLVACITTSRTDFDRQKYAPAAAQLVVCDSLVAASEANFSASSSNPNPSGGIRGRLGNLYLTINTRILGNAPGAHWPP